MSSAFSFKGKHYATSKQKFDLEQDTEPSIVPDVYW